MRRILPALLLIGACLIATPLPAMAFDPFDRGNNEHAVNCANSKEKKSTVCSTDSAFNPLTGPDGIFVKITNVVAYFAGALAISAELRQSTRRHW